LLTRRSWPVSDRWSRPPAFATTFGLFGHFKIKTNGVLTNFKQNPRYKAFFRRMNLPE
jgi:hypothetical protein